MGGSAGQVLLRSTRHEGSSKPTFRRSGQEMVALQRGKRRPGKNRRRFHSSARKKKGGGGEQIRTRAATRVSSSYQAGGNYKNHQRLKKGTVGRKEKRVEDEPPTKNLDEEKYQFVNDLRAPRKREAYHSQSERKKAEAPAKNQQ